MQKHHLEVPHQVSADLSRLKDVFDVELPEVLNGFLQVVILVLDDAHNLLVDLRGLLRRDGPKG